MPAVELTEEQVIALVDQLPPERKRSLLLSLANSSPAARTARMQAVEERFRAACKERGLDWNVMTEEEREEFVDQLVHEDR
jgi:hypothetical protein